MGLTTFAGSQPTLKEAAVAKNYLNEKELRATGQLFILYMAGVISKVLHQKQIMNNRKEVLHV